MTALSHLEKKGKCTPVINIDEILHSFENIRKQQNKTNKKKI